jgi:hypothetical protein
MSLTYQLQIRVTDVHISFSDRVSQSIVHFAVDAVALQPVIDPVDVNKKEVTISPHVRGVTSATQSKSSRSRASTAGSESLVMGSSPPPSLPSSLNASRVVTATRSCSVRSSHTNPNLSARCANSTPTVMRKSGRICQTNLIICEQSCDTRLCCICVIAVRATGHAYSRDVW